LYYVSVEGITITVQRVTNKLKYVDTTGRIEKFQNKFAAGSYASLQSKTTKKKKKGL
jgi:hypothetical protein